MTVKTRRGWRIGVALATVAVVLLSGLAVFAKGVLETRHLVRTNPDLAVQDPSLMRIAETRGTPVFRQYCAACHGPKGEGDPERGVPNLTDGDWLYGSGAPSEIEQTVLYGIRSGHPKAWNLAVMPAYASAVPDDKEKVSPLTPAQMSDVVEYLVQFHGTPTSAEAARRGEALYHGAGGCYDCHAPDAAGDSAVGAPNLRDDIWLYGHGDRKTLTQTLERGRQGVCPAWVLKLQPAEIRAVSLYVYALSHRSRS